MKNNKSILRIATYVSIFISIFINYSCLSLMIEKEPLVDKYQQSNMGKIVFATRPFGKKNNEPVLKGEFRLNDKIHTQVYFKDTLYSLYSKTDLTCKAPTNSPVYFTLKINNKPVGYKVNDNRFPKMFMDVYRFNHKRFLRSRSLPNFKYLSPLYSKLKYKKVNDISDNFLRFALPKLKVGKNKIKLALHSYCEVEGSSTYNRKFGLLQEPVSEGSFVLKISSKRELKKFTKKLTRNFPPADKYLSRAKYPDKKVFDQISNTSLKIKKMGKPIEVAVENYWNLTKNEYTGILLHRTKYGFIKWKRKNNECISKKFFWEQKYISGNNFANARLSIYGPDYWIPCNK